MDDVRQARCWTGSEEWKEAENEGKLNKSKEEPKEKKDDSRRLEIAAAGLMVMHTHSLAPFSIVRLKTGRDR